MIEKYSGIYNTVLQHHIVVTRIFFWLFCTLKFAILPAEGNRLAKKRVENDSHQSTIDGGKAHEVDFLLRFYNEAPISYYASYFSSMS